MLDEALVVAMLKAMASAMYRSAGWITLLVALLGLGASFLPRGPEKSPPPGAPEAGASGQD